MASDNGINLLRKKISEIQDRSKRSIANKVISRLPKETSLRTIVDLIDSEIKIKIDLNGEGNGLYGQMNLCQKSTTCYEMYDLNRCNSNQCPFYRK